jgi:hypothetical protein
MECSILNTKNPNVFMFLSVSVKVLPALKFTPLMHKPSDISLLLKHWLRTMGYEMGCTMN